MKRAALISATVLCVFITVVLLPGPSFGVRHTRAVSPKIGVLLNGSAEDRSYSQAQYEAITAVCSRKGLKLVCQDCVPLDDTFTALAENLIREGCGMIFCDNYILDPQMEQLAAAHPDICFVNVSGTVVADNLSPCMGRAYQVRYLAGLAAGRQTRTNEIGYVLAFLTPETIRQLNAFTIGVRKVNPDATVYVRRTDDWNDGEKAASATAALLDAHQIDVLTQHTNTIAPIRLADQRGIWVIGNNYDNHALFPDTWLTGCVFHWEVTFERYISKYLDRKFQGAKGTSYWEGLREGLVDLAPLSDLTPPETAEIVEAERNRILSGNFDVFYGPLTDIYGTVQVRENENLSDRQFLYSMYWFVDGVVIES